MHTSSRSDSTTGMNPLQSSRCKGAIADDASKQDVTKTLLLDCHLWEPNLYVTIQERLRNNARIEVWLGSWGAAGRHDDRWTDHGENHVPLIPHSLVPTYINLYILSDMKLLRPMGVSR
jgi:hypothetical protein